MVVFLLGCPRGDMDHILRLLLPSGRWAKEHHLMRSKNLSIRNSTDHGGEVVNSILMLLALLCVFALTLFALAVTYDPGPTAGALKRQFPYFVLDGSTPLFISRDFDSPYMEFEYEVPNSNRERSSIESLGHRCKSGGWNLFSQTDDELRCYQFASRGVMGSVPVLATLTLIREERKIVVKWWVADGAVKCFHGAEMIKWPGLSR